MTSDRTRMEDVASAMDSASPTPFPARAVGSSDAADHAASNGGFAASYTAVLSPVRSMTMSNILNGEEDEVVAGSDQDGDQASPTATYSSLVAVPAQLVNPAVAQPVEMAPRADGVGRDDAAAGLLMRLAISTSHGGSAATVETSGAVGTAEEKEETTPSQTEAVDVEMAAVEATASEAPAPTVTSAVTETVEAATTEPRRNKRGRPIKARAPSKKAKGKAKATKKTPVKAAVEAPPVAEATGESAVTGGLETESTQPQAETQPPPAATTRTREKRRTPPPPAPVRATPSKKPKTSAKPAAPAPTMDVPMTSARPKRASVKVISSYSELTVTEEDEDEEDDVPMVIASENVKASREAAEAAAAEAAAAASSTHVRASSASDKKALKRKTMSQRQFDELMSGEVVGDSIDVDAVDVEALAHVVAAPVAAPAKKQRPCEYCHLSHSAFAMFYCHSCRRVYHGRCLVDAIRPAMKEGVAIEAQMEELTLYRPGGRSSVLRCVSCQAAFIDLFKQQESHRDCTCFTCMKTPQKTADYRRVSLKMIVDEHNEQSALKKKGGKAPKKTLATAATPLATPSAGKTTKARASAKKEEAAAPVEEAVSSVEETAQYSRARSARASRRTRDSNQPDDEDTVEAVGEAKAQEPETPEPQEEKPMASKAKIVVSVKSNRRARGRGAKKSVAEPMDVDSTSNGHGGEKTEPMEVDSVSTQQQQDEPTRGDIKMAEQVDEDVSSQVTTSTLEQLIQITKDDSNDSWSFRVACSPSGKANESGMCKEATFVWHPKNAKTLECCCCQKSGMSLRWFIHHTDPTLPTALDDDPHEFMFVVRKDGKLVPLDPVLKVVRLAWTQTKRRASGGSAAGEETKLKGELDEKRKQATLVLSGVTFTPIIRDRKRRSSDAVRPEFMCEVICAEERYLPAIVTDDKLLSNRLQGLGTDALRKGQLEVRENPLGKIYCECCKQKLSLKNFREHLQKTLEIVRTQQRLQEEEDRRKNSQRGGYDSNYPRYESTADRQVDRAVKVAMGVARGPLSVLKMECFVAALQQLGSQTEINKAITAILQTQGGANP